MKNTHIEHLDDLILIGGKEGIIKTLDAIDYLINRVLIYEDTKNISLKIDGSPSFIAGIDPTDKRFFIASKFNLTKKTTELYKSIEDIKNSKISDDLKIIYSQLFELLYSNLNFKEGIYQGDLLYNILENYKIENNNVIFHPNTLLYSFDKKSKYYDKIIKSKIGICWHTEYKGETIKDLSGLPFNNKKDIFKSEDIFKMSTDINIKNKNININSIEREYRIIKRFFKMLSIDFINDLYNTQKLKHELKVFYNINVRQGKEIENIEKYFEDFKEYINIKKLKFTRKDQIEVEEFINNHSKDDFYKLFLMFGLVMEIKLKIIEVLNRNISFGDVFIKTKDGLIDTKHEGFVLFFNSSYIKLVDRLEFSHNNFSKDVIKGWEK